ncbi:membrane-bound lytic murein transglycosylase D [Parabacteroides sp. PF5-5]|uniref:lytic transglycosylase domain-containing protein n=1 Tax=unclassified Parabacteroides TaxID=2649774 RepID=UPI002473B2EB|nr:MULTISPECIES: lytic transglycosylase domain-containing protein [unclassified Parabacteroides]MDH6304470.1 membrane-bound lytic murein transglycosylase D [Parabacteroides sp. PH5-39]MDH6315377.1 membrane-bound lytic murein transglycosylase D [Parabacteroides sp. PF5-13]MDH6319129.1 membrane-bound lytic murein transglycosylase D [Parabacteroides sp. PH5-13]MDH6322859.1 membrane-bound lytic murein transglycosylase D [Parabacteroides sp. PH5-8]MDH6326569.1 membrane-bound lytic murein transglyco
MYKTKLLNKKIFSLAIAGAICLTACIAISSNDAEKVKEERPLVSSITTSPEVPSSVRLFGKDVDITRYDMHEGFDREISSFTYFHSTTMLMIKRANYVFPIIEPILKANGIPDDFKYLAVIESHLDPRVSSPARAVGTWQFLESTGKEHGLTVTPTVDERCDVAKSTVAACKYLKAAYAKYGDWFNVAASYNAGMGRITGELTKQQAESTFDLYLVQETTRYPYRIMAIKQVFENPYKYGFVLHAKDLYKPIRTREVAVSKDIIDLAAFAKEQGVSYADIKRFNPWLRDRKLNTLGKTYKIQIPLESDMYYKQPNTHVHDPRWVVK